MVASPSIAGEADVFFFPGACVTLESRLAQLCGVGPAQPTISESQGEVGRRAIVPASRSCAPPTQTGFYFQQKCRQREREMKTETEKHLNMTLHEPIVTQNTSENLQPLSLHAKRSELCSYVESFMTQAQLDNSVTHPSARYHSHQH